MAVAGVTAVGLAACGGSGGGSSGPSPSQNPTPKPNPADDPTPGPLNGPQTGAPANATTIDASLVTDGAQLSGPYLINGSLDGKSINHQGGGKLYINGDFDNANLVANGPVEINGSVGQNSTSSVTISNGSFGSTNTDDIIIGGDANLVGGALTATGDVYIGSDVDTSGVINGIGNGTIESSTGVNSQNGGINVATISDVDFLQADNGTVNVKVIVNTAGHQIVMQSKNLNAGIIGEGTSFAISSTANANVIRSSDASPETKTSGTGIGSNAKINVANDNVAQADEISAQTGIQLALADITIKGQSVGRLYQN